MLFRLMFVRFDSPLKSRSDLGVCAQMPVKRKGAAAKTAAATKRTKPGAASAAAAAAATEAAASTADSKSVAAAAASRSGATHARSVLPPGARPQRLFELLSAALPDCSYDAVSIVAS